MCQDSIVPIASFRRLLEFLKTTQNRKAAHQIPDMTVLSKCTLSYKHSRGTYGMLLASRLILYETGLA